MERMTKKPRGRPKKDPRDLARNVGMRLHPDVIKSIRATAKGKNISMAQAVSFAFKIPTKETT